MLHEMSDEMERELLGLVELLEEKLYRLENLVENLEGQAPDDDAWMGTWDEGALNDKVEYLSDAAMSLSDAVRAITDSVEA